MGSHAIVMALYLYIFILRIWDRKNMYIVKAWNVLVLDFSLEYVCMYILWIITCSGAERIQPRYKEYLAVRMYVYLYQ